MSGLKGSSTRDQDALGLLAVGYAAKIYWDTLEEPEMIVVANRGVIGLIGHEAAPSKDRFLEELAPYQAWKGAPDGERVVGSQARYTGTLGEARQTSRITF